MSRLASSLPGCLTAAKSTFSTLSLGQNLQKAFMAFIRAHTEPAQERQGQTWNVTDALKFLSHRKFTFSKTCCIDWYDLFFRTEPWPQPTSSPQVLGWRSHVLTNQASKLISPYGFGGVQSSFLCPTCLLYVLGPSVHAHSLCSCARHVALMFVRVGGCEFQVKTVEVDDGLLEDRFAKTVTMSTYLVAFVICDFKSVTARTSSGVQVSLMEFNCTMYSFPVPLLSHSQLLLCRCPSTLLLRSGCSPTMHWKLQSKC